MVIKILKLHFLFLAYGLQNLKTIPSLKEFESAYNSIYGQKVIKEKVKLLHCTSEYPAPISQSNLLSIKSLNSAFGIEVGSQIIR